MGLSVGVDVGADVSIEARRHRNKFDVTALINSGSLLRADWVRHDVRGEFWVGILRSLGGTTSVRQQVYTPEFLLTYGEY